MSSRFTQILLALSLLLNTFVLAGFVYRSWIAPPPFERHMPTPPGGPRPGVFETVANDLELDDAQRNATRGLFETYATARRERLLEIQKVREQIAAEYKRPTTDLARLETLVDQLTSLRAEQHKETLRSLAQLEIQLKPQQRERMRQVLAERLAASSRTQRQPGPGPGRPTQ